MEVGRIPDIDNAKISNVEKIQKVPEVDDNPKVKDNEEHKKANKEVVVDLPNEIIIDNVKFGYNKASQDFFIKVTRGEAEYRFPTEDMMKVKAHLLAKVAEVLDKG
ncbi:MAG: flagellin [Campylobacteraceae bacterium]|nr:flagellin [Campylobacteraceae bacterium]